MAQHVVTSSSAASKHVEPKADIFMNRSLSVKLRDKPLLPDSSLNSSKNTSPVSPFDVDFCNSDDKSCPESPYTPVEPKMKSEFELMNNNFKETNLHSEFKIDILNSVVQTQAKYDDLCNENVNPFAADRGGNLEGSVWIDGIENYLKFKRFCENQKAERRDKLNRRISKLQDLYGKIDRFTYCSRCDAKLKEKMEIFFYMDKGFCSKDCRENFMEKYNKPEIVYDDELIPFRFYKYKGPIFLPIK